jgi:DNA-binding response OmpR family regulator
MKPRLLLVDNTPEFLGIQARLLEQSTYDVFTASTVEEAEAILEQNWVHIAIIDQRMEDDNDEHDISGLILAREEQFRNIPKIILTAFPDYESAISALNTIKGYPSAIEYIAKQKGPKALSDAVLWVLAHHIHINWTLEIEWKARDKYSLTSSIEPGSTDELLLNRAGELEDLFRRLFFEKDYVRLDRLLWQRNGRVALVVYTFKEGTIPESMLVICGKHDIVIEETDHYNKYAPKAPGTTGTVLSLNTETTHFAANAYTLVNNDLEQFQTLVELYRNSNEKVLNTAITNLVEETLKAWHQNRSIREKEKTLDTLYCERLHLKDLLTQDYFETRIKAISDQIPSMNAKIERVDEKLTIRFNTQFYIYKDPLPFIFKNIDAKLPILMTVVSGVLTGNNILTDNTGRTWLTDFSDAGLAPFLWNLVTLESTFRFDLIETGNLQQRYELEKCLVFTDFAKPDIRDIDPAVRKLAQIIRVIRKLASPAVGKDFFPYNRGIFFHAVRRLADFNPGYPSTSSELLRLGHILLSMSMLVSSMEVKEGGQKKQEQQEELSITDRTSLIVWVGNRELHFAPQPFNLLLYLYENANRICTSKELIEKALAGKYDKRYLQTLIGRIRKQIEDDPTQPRYLFTEQNVGYRLITKP